MIKQQYFLAFLATNLLVALTNQSAMGFTLKSGNGAINYYNPTVPYVIDANTRGTTFLSPRYVAPIQLGGTRAFLNMLKNDVRWRGWDFISSKKNLYGNFEISDYYGCGSQTNCAKQRPNDTIRGGVGAYIDIKYNPKKTDPEPGQGKIHWIQHIVNNHASFDEHQSTSSEGLHGVPYDGIDIRPFQNVNPYYPGGTEFSFYDRPYRPDAKNPHTWFAELYLVEETAEREVTIYNGIRWGWINKVYRRKNPLPIPIPIRIPEIPKFEPIPIPIPKITDLVCNPGSGGGGCNRTQTDGIFDNDSIENINQEISYSNIDETNWTEDFDFDINDPDWIEEQDPSVPEFENWDWTSDEEPILDENQEEDNSESPVSVPESTSALGLLALGAWGIMKAMKIRLEK
ncbi:hypothetical protein [Nostoc sp. 'Peltigera membranacea cyanobiont' 232]|uniref:hypothetical protein n=1 Tax=Nostoc sp. 'Peltigera membranacea cyanobiont' 232 TaxID=2014531 RepID=UPI000B9544B0|nr:hypothetical protein [Nostoc sp. 'Peltigera membranacea cyanobiont' 232]OYE03111.1 hypothetical protein CDG79_20215 [Nostoc sp. 'Peltigera membranacea cyanobiont' 232]